MVFPPIRTARPALPTLLAMLQAAHATHPPEDATAPTTVRHLRQVLLWPLRLIAAPDHAADAAPQRSPWQAKRALVAASPWREQFDEYTGNERQFHERHYNVFVAFLPSVQRFL